MTKLFGVFAFLAVMALPVASANEFTEKAAVLPDAGRINCDDRAQFQRVAFDPASKRIWIVRLNQLGRPETRLPDELRIHEVTVKDFKTVGCAACVQAKFTLQPNMQFPVAMVRIDRNLSGGRFPHYILNAFDISDPARPEHTLQNIPCWTR